MESGNIELAGFQSKSLAFITEQITKPNLQVNSKLDAIRAAAVQSARELGLTISTLPDDKQSVVFSNKRKSIYISGQATPLEVAELVLIAEAIIDSGSKVHIASKYLSQAYDQLETMYVLASKQNIIDEPTLRSHKSRLNQLKDNIKEDSVIRLILQ